MIVTLKYNQLISIKGTQLGNLFARTVREQLLTKNSVDGAQGEPPSSIDGLSILLKQSNLYTKPKRLKVTSQILPSLFPPCQLPTD
jgi:hypothetical protein